MSISLSFMTKESYPAWSWTFCCCCFQGSNILPKSLPICSFYKSLWLLWIKKYFSLWKYGKFTLNTTMFPSFILLKLNTEWLKRIHISGRHFKVNCFILQIVLLRFKSKSHFLVFVKYFFHCVSDVTSFIKSAMIYSLIVQLFLVVPFTLVCANWNCFIDPNALSGSALFYLADDYLSIHTCT